MLRYLLALGKAGTVEVAIEHLAILRHAGPDKVGVNRVEHLNLGVYAEIGELSRFFGHAIIENALHHGVMSYWFFVAARREGIVTHGATRGKQSEAKQARV